MWRIFKLFTRQHFIDSYPNKWTVLGELLAVIVQLTIYWYTAKAFGANFSGNYFYFIVIGHLSLSIAFALFGGISLDVKNAALDGSLETFLVAPVKPQIIFLIRSLALVVHDLARITITLLIAMVFFEFKINNFSALWVIVLQILSIPVFMGAGLLAASLLIFFGRGSSLVGHLVTLFSILSGMYFPITVFPSIIQKLSIYLTPFGFLLMSMRKILDGDSAAALAALPWIIGWALLLLPLSYFAFDFAVNALKKRGRPLLLT